MSELVLPPPVPSDVDPAFAYAARLAAIDAQAEQDPLAPLTRDAYRRGWNTFEDWCIEQRVTPMPASPETIRAFVANLRDRDQPASIFTINQHLAAIWARHGQEGKPAPKDNDALKIRRQGYARQDQARLIRQMTALLVHDLQRIMSSMDAQLRDALAVESDPRARRKHELLDLRDRAVLLIGMSTALRREELARIGVEHCARDERGIVITPPHTKTDQTVPAETHALSPGTTTWRRARSPRWSAGTPAPGSPPVRCFGG